MIPLNRDKQLGGKFTPKPLAAPSPVQTAVPTVAPPITIPPGGNAPVPVQPPVATTPVVPTAPATPTVPAATPLYTKTWQPTSLNQPAPTTPAQVVTPQSTALPALDGQQYVATGTSPTPGQINFNSNWQPGQVTPGQAWNVPNAGTSGSVVQGYLNNLLSENGSYLQSAMRHGLETANSRGLMNSSIAGGASQRAAIDAAQPILNNIMDLHQSREGMAFQQGENSLQRALEQQLQQQGFSFEDAQAEAQRRTAVAMEREGRAFQGHQAALDRTQNVNNTMLQGTINERMFQLQQDATANQARQDFEFRRALQSDEAAQQDWLRSNQFRDQFNAEIATLPINGAMDMLGALTQYALNDPETFTPDVVSGFTTFFNNNMISMLSQYFPEDTSSE